MAPTALTHLGLRLETRLSIALEHFIDPVSNLPVDAKFQYQQPETPKSLSSAWAERECVGPGNQKAILRTEQEIPPRC